MEYLVLVAGGCTVMAASGLALCKKIGGIHRGKIWVESTVGEGTAFHSTLQACNNTVSPMLLDLP